MEWITDPQVWIGFATLTMLEVVLGIDNVIFISILSEKLPEAQQDRARILGLGLAMVTRILLLFTLSWVIGLSNPLFTVLGQEISGRDLVLLLGGQLWKHTGPDSPARHCILPRFGNYRGGNGGANRRHGRRSGGGRDFYDDLR
jgi:predicted tellurium resistance membrane protein TerC